jgi:DNA-binding NarL/FixJ family response regulator
VGWRKQPGRVGNSNHFGYQFAYFAVIRRKNWHSYQMRNARLILVEDDAFTRATLGDALILQGFDVKARVATAAEALAAQEEHAPQVAVLDLDLGIGPTGIDVAIALRSKNPQIGIVFLTTYKDPRLIESNLPTLPEGAIYLNKLEMNSTSAIASQISAAMFKPLMRRSFPWIRNSPLSALSILQIEIMKEIAEGASTSEIAKSRGVSEQAIDKSISRISKHLGLPKSANSHQRVQIVRAYFENKGQGV